MNQIVCGWGSKIPRPIVAIFTRRKEYPFIDKIVVAYIGVVLFFQILLQISPAITFLATTPLYSIQTYLGLLGGFLIVVDCFTTKRIWQGKYCLLLWAIMALAAMASVRTISYGVKENAFKLCWMAIQFALMYTCAFRLEQVQFRKITKAFFYVLLAIWFVACCVSLYQYVNLIGYKYVVNPLAKDASANRQGFFDNRLFGIFYTLNHAAYVSLIFLVISVVCMVKEKRTWVKVCLIIADLALMSYIILSGSRSAMISFLVCGAIMAWFAVRNALKHRGKFGPVTWCVVAVAVVVLCYFGYAGMKSGLSMVPYLKDPFAYNENILNRDYLEEDFSNDRLEIWTDYIGLYREVGLLGMSPGNYMPYILENNPDLYIVERIKQKYPEKYESGIIYHVHNGYLMVYVSAGILGALSLVVFMLLYLKRLIGLIMKHKRISGLFIGAFALVAAGAISALFDEGLFFQNNPQTTMFWLALGILMSDRLVEKTEQVQID